jgi:hypothetical protein
MIVEISLGKDYKEWCILELQGQLLGAKLEGERVGEIEVMEDGTCVMDVGQHILKGSVKSIANPFLVLKNSAEQKGKNGEATAGENGGGIEMSSMTVLAVVKKKILFQSRPKPKGIKLDWEKP